MRKNSCQPIFYPSPVGETLAFERKKG